MSVPKLHHEIRDPIHVFVRLDSDERKVLDSRPFQRLRYIHQLAEILSNVVAGAGQAARCSISSPSLNFFPAKTWTISSEPLSLRQRVSA